MSPLSPLERLDRLERALASISAEVASIRAELNATGTTSAPPSPAAEPVENPEHRPPPIPPRRRAGDKSESLDLERLLGRYGMLAIAVLAAVAAVGTFLSWAISHGYLHLGPAARILIGLSAAAALGAWGLQLRVRERSFGSSILGLALVIVQVCAYAAGPAFHLVPTLAAFAGAAIVSWTLAIFAHAENDEPLWCVGFGGAALAPFVTSDGTGNVYALLAYATLVLLPACFAISDRAWPVAWRVFYIVSALFVLSGAELAHRTSVVAYLLAFALPFVVAAAGVIPFAPLERKRAALRWLAMLATVSAFWAPGYGTARSWAVAGTVLGGMGTWLFMLDRQAAVAQSSLLVRNKDSVTLLDWLDAAFIPLLLAFSAEAVLGAEPRALPIYAAATIAFLVFTWRRALNSLRDAAAFSTIFMASVALATVHVEEPLGRLSAFVLLGVVALALHRAKPSMSWLGSGLVILAGSAIASSAFLEERIPFTSTPFLTEQSLTALVVLVALICVARFWYSLRIATRTAMGDRPEWSYATFARRLVRGVNVAPWVWAFVWIAIELSMAYSSSTATLLLVTYFAATAIACVGVGHLRRSPRLRQVGLLLALGAAGTAVYGATTYFDIGARILAYLVTSAFLLGIAYWYRRPGGLESATDAA